MDFAKSFNLVKQHPVATGAVVIGGGLVFFLIFNGGGGSSAPVTAVGNTGPSAAQLAASAQIQMAQIGANVQLGAAQIAAQAQKDSDAAALQAQKEELLFQSKVADLSSAIKMAEINTNKDIAFKTVDASVTLESLSSNNALEALRINNASQESFFSNLINVLRPATSNVGSSPTVTPTLPLPSQEPKPTTPTPTAPAQFDPFNTSNSSQPLFQGYDAIIAQQIDAGAIRINNGIATIAGDSNSAPGTYVLTNPLDVRWNSYQPGAYSSGNFHGI